MNQQFVVAQLSAVPGAGTPPKIVKLTKPQDNQAITLFLDGATKVDFSEIANEQITLVHVGDRLIVLFQGGATVSVAPFFDASGQPLPDITVQLAPDRVVTSSQFASIFPITDDQSVLPAAGPSSSSSPYFEQQPVITDGRIESRPLASS